MTVVMAAHPMKMKNRAPQKRPPLMEAKILGRVTKISVGPAAGSTPNVKQAGKMIKPESSATIKSMPVIRQTSPGRDRFLPM